MPTVCIDCRYIGPRPSGIAEVVRALVDFAPGLAPDLDFLLLKHPSQTAPLSAAANVREIIVAHPANGPTTLWRLPRVVDLTGVDLFHAPFNIMPAGLAMPCVVTVHDTMWLTRPDLCGTGPWNRIERLFYAHGIGRALRDAAAIATVSAASRDAILALRPAAADRTVVTLSGVSPDFRPPDAASTRAGRRYVLTVGQDAPYKNHDGAVRAFALAFRDRDDIDLVLVQRRTRRSRRLTRLAESLGVTPERIQFRRALSRADLVRLYGEAAALLHPSFCEGFGNPVAEAMACGCPVVTSDCSAMPEVAGGAALLADPRDSDAIAAALRTAVDSPDAADAMRRRGLARAAALDWRRFAADTIAIYRRVLAEAGR